MSIRDRWLPIAFLLAVLGLVLVTGCGKYENLERNMQYVSDDLLHRDALAAWEALKAAHARWSTAGFTREKGNAAFDAYQDAYDRYAVIYNELVERGGRSFGASLHGLSNELPPPPPGVHAGAPAPAPVDALAPTAAPPARDLDAGASASTAGVPLGVPVAPAVQPVAPAPAPAPVSAATASEPASGAGTRTSSDSQRYVIKPGDSLRGIAKRHGITEKKLMDANGLTDPDKIAAGKALTIPAP